MIVLGGLLVGVPFCCCFCYYVRFGLLLVFVWVDYSGGDGWVVCIVLIMILSFGGLRYYLGYIKFIWVAFCFLFAW